MTKLVYLLKKITSFYSSHVFATAKSNLFLCLFFLAYIHITVYHSHLYIVTYILYQTCKQQTRLIYEDTFFNNNFNNFNKFELNFEFNVTVETWMNSNFYVANFYSVVQFTSLNIFKALTLECTSISISPDPLFFACFFSVFFAYF